MPLPTPIGRQREVLYLPAEGHTVVLGTAGSGKTVLAILRAAYLANPATDHFGRTLLLTFNKALVAYLRHIGGAELANVTVENYHRFARGYLAARGKIEYNDICRPWRRLQLVKEVICSIQHSPAAHPVLDLPAEWLAEEIQRINQLGIQTAAEYRLAPPHLPAPIVQDDPSLRALWQLCQDYKVLRQNSGFRYDWDDLAITVSDEFDEDKSVRLYRHIVVDEGQDFSPVMIKSLTKAVANGGSFTFFGDVAQQIYGHRYSWRSAGLTFSKPWIFEENYRNTKQIAELALAISRMPYYKGGADLVSPKSPRASGPLPALVAFKTVAAETKFVVEQAIAQSKVGSVAILVPSHDEKQRFCRQFGAGSFVELSSEIGRWRSSSGLSIGTYHSGKGVEFDSVILPGVNGTSFPDAEAIRISGKEYAEQSSGRLLYVGVTRAKATLIMSYSGAVTPLLPTSDKLIQRSDG